MLAISSIYEVHSTIISQVLRFHILQETGAHKNLKTQTKQANITGIHYLSGFWFAYMRMKRSGVKFVLSFILSLFYFLKICASFPFRLHLRQSTLPPPVPAVTRKSKTTSKLTTNKSPATAEPFWHPPHSHSCICRRACLRLLKIPPSPPTFVIRHCRRQRWRLSIVDYPM